MASRDLFNNVNAVQSLAPATRNANTNGTGADLQGFEAAMAVFEVGAITDGTHTPAVEESDDDSAYTAVAAADLQGTLANFTANSIQRVGYLGSKRYIRAQVNSSGTTGAAYSAVIARGHARHAPVT